MQIPIIWSTCTHVKALLLSHTQCPGSITPGAGVREPASPHAGRVHEQALEKLPTRRHARACYS